MTGSELAAALGGLLFLAFAAGWAAHWLWSRAARAASPRRDRADELVAELLLVEEAREREQAEAAAREAALIEAAAAERAAATARERAQAAEREALDSGLRAARAEIEALRR